jgi:hypothetical protein
MTPALSKEEEDFVRWMDEVDLEEVNLLEAPVQAPTDVQQHERLSGEKPLQELPPQRGVGWD